MRGKSSRQMIKLIEEDGWYLVEVVGDHHQYKHKKKSGKVTIPHPTKDINIKTANSILKQAGLK